MLEQVVSVDESVIKKVTTEEARLLWDLGSRVYYQLSFKYDPYRRAYIHRYFSCAARPTGIFRYGVLKD